MIPSSSSVFRRRDARGASWSVRVGIGFLCVFFGVALACVAPAVAGPTIDEVTVEDDEAWIGTEEEHEVGIEASNLETGEAPATVTVSASGWPDDAIVGSPDVEIGTDGVEIEGDAETDGTTVTFDVNDTSETTIDLEADVTITLEHPLESSFDGAEYAVDVTVEDTDGSAGSDAVVTLKRLSYAVDGEERFPPDTEFVYRGQTVTVENLEPGTEYTLFEFDPDDETAGDPVESVTPSGSTATIDTSSVSGGEPIDPGWYVVYDGSDGDVVPTTENAFQVRTQQLDATQADGTVDSTGDGAETSVTLDSPLRSTAFDVNVTSADLDGDGLFDVFEGETNADVERIGDERIVIRDVQAGASVPMTFEPVLAATYGFEFEVTDTGAEADTTVVVEEREVGAAFGGDLFETNAGDIVEIDVALQDTDEAYVMIGGDKASGERELTNYFDILHVEGDATIRMNTRLLGTNVPSEEAYEAEGAEVTSYLQEPSHDGFDGVSFEGSADDLSAFRSEIGIGALPRPIQPERLRLVVGDSGSVVVRDDGVPDFERPLDRSNVLIDDTDGFGNVTTYVAPGGSASEFDAADGLGELEGQLTQRRTVAKGDRLVFGIEADGLTGLVSWLDGRLSPDDPGFEPAALSTLLEFPDGVALEAEQTNPGRNERAAALDLGGATDGDASLFYEPARNEGDRLAIDQYYLVIDTRGSGPFDRSIDPGDEYRFRFGYDTSGETDWFGTVDHDALDPNGAAPHFPYAEREADNESETRLVTVEERTVEYETVDSRDRPVLRSATAASVSGRTNLAPGTEVSLQLIPEGRDGGDRITIEDVEIDDDGTFEFTHDLSGLDPGEGIEVEFYAEQRLLDKRAGVVAGADEPLVEYRIAEHTGSATLKKGEPFSTISATVENVGYVPGERSVRLVIDNGTASSRSVELTRDGSETVRFGGTVDLDPGEYEYAITADGTEATGLLTVEERDETDPSDAAGSEPVSDDSAGAEGDGEDGPEGDEEDEEGGAVAGALGAIPIGARHAIGGAAVVGAAHVLGHWS